MRNCSSFTRTRSKRRGTLSGLWRGEEGREGGREEGKEEEKERGKEEEKERGKEEEKERGRKELTYTNHNQIMTNNLLTLKLLRWYVFSTAQPARTHHVTM